MEFFSFSQDQSIALGARLAHALKGGELIALNGDLGAGKTVFCKGIAQGLGLDCVITSPTFCIFNRYEEGRLVLNHFDVYRLSSGEEALQMGLEEFLHEQNAVCVVEWAENIADILPQNRINITIKNHNEGRKIIIEGIAI